MSALQKKSTSYLLLFVYIWAVFLGELTHRVIHHLQDTQKVVLEHHHSLSCLSESTEQLPADEQLDAPSAQGFLKSPDCVFELALHVLLGEQGQSQFSLPLSPPPPARLASLLYRDDHFLNRKVCDLNQTRGPPTLA